MTVLFPLGSIVSVRLLRESYRTVNRFRYSAGLGKFGSSVPSHCSACTTVDSAKSYCMAERSFVRHCRRSLEHRQTRGAQAFITAAHVVNAAQAELNSALDLRKAAGWESSQGGGKKTSLGCGEDVQQAGPLKYNCSGSWLQVDSHLQNTRPQRIRSLASRDTPEDRNRAYPAGRELRSARPAVREPPPEGVALLEHHHDFAGSLRMGERAVLGSCSRR